jgi:hypothetical protein
MGDPIAAEKPIPNSNPLVGVSADDRARKQSGECRAARLLGHAFARDRPKRARAVARDHWDDPGSLVRSCCHCRQISTSAGLGIARRPWISQSFEDARKKLFQFDKLYPLIHLSASIWVAKNRK